MLEQGESVCCALSGGADSVALLLSLRKLSDEPGISLYISAVHINHLLRGEESTRDEDFCRSLCERLGIPLKIFRRDAAEFSRSLGMSVETGARKLRYEIFEEILETDFADKIATAHNLNDNAETVLFRLARGTGLKGLTGIPPVRGKIIRPLITCSREEIEAFLASEGQDFVTDSTNLSDDYARNRIRHRIMPEMTAVHGGFPHCTAAAIASLAEDEDFLSAEAEKHENDDLRTLHPAIRKRIIINLLKLHNVEITAKRVAEIDSALMQEEKLQDNVSADRNCLISVKKGKIFFSEAAENLNRISPLKIENDGVYPFAGDRIVIISKENCEKMNSRSIVNKKLTTDALDYDKIQGGIVLRNRLREDRIKPAGTAHTRELRKLLQERLPREKRGLSAVIADDCGVIWSECAGIADRVKPDENTRILLKIETARTAKTAAADIQQ